MDVDKGFLFSTFDDSFVCQKKNHFQLTIHADTNTVPAYVKTNSGTIEAIDSCYLHFFGIKVVPQIKLVLVVFVKVTYILKNIFANRHY